VEKTFSAWSTVDYSRYQKERWLPTMWKYQFKQPDSNRLCGKTNLSNPTVTDDVVNTNLNNLNRTPNATIRTNILHQVVYIILHQIHLIPHVNKINRNTTQSEQFHNSIINLVLKSRQHSSYFWCDIRFEEPGRQTCWNTR
jgi:hypothetical protein